jgi:hypothetical protein
MSKKTIWRRGHGQAFTKMGGSMHDWLEVGESRNRASLQQQIESEIAVLCR